VTVEICSMTIYKQLLDLNFFYTLIENVIIASKVDISLRK